jgi:hypothetical protein
MATKKQRRRRAKEQRHDYVWVDDEGNELDAEDVPDDKSPGPARRGRGQRQPQAPSWTRTLKRALIFAPIMFGTVLLLSPHLSTTTKITQTLLIVAIFVPFSYLVDRFLYRSFLRREARARQPAGRRGS